MSVKRGAYFSRVRLEVEVVPSALGIRPPWHLLCHSTPTNGPCREEWKCGRKGWERGEEGEGEGEGWGGMGEGD